MIALPAAGYPAFQLYYDEEHGQVVEEIDGAVRTLIEVRKGMEDKVTEQAVIAEMEKRGYVILGPYPSEAPE